MQPKLSGPEEVMPGSSFQVSVRNPRNEVLSTAVLMDSSLIEGTGELGGSGRVAVDVPPRGVASITLKVRAHAKSTDTNLSVEGGGEPWVLRVRSAGDPAADNPLPDAPADEPGQ